MSFKYVTTTSPGFTIATLRLPDADGRLLAIRGWFILRRQVFRSNNAGGFSISTFAATVIPKPDEPGSSSAA